MLASFSSVARGATARAARIGQPHAHIMVPATACAVAPAASSSSSSVRLFSAAAAPRRARSKSSRLSPVREARYAERVKKQAEVVARAAALQEAKRVAAVARAEKRGIQLPTPEAPPAPLSPKEKAALKFRKARRARMLAMLDAHISDARSPPTAKAAAAAAVPLLQRQRARLHWFGQRPAKTFYAEASARGQIMKRSFRGIFAGKHVGFGNMVSHSTRKTRRTWQPNVHRKEILSLVLERELPLLVSMAAYRTFDKYGGLDRYLLRSKLHKLDLGLTRDLRTAMEITLLNSPAIAKRLHLEDVLARVQQPAYAASLRAVEARRFEAEEAAEAPGASPLPRRHFLAAPRYLSQPTATLATGVVVQRFLKPSERAALSPAQRAAADAADAARFAVDEARAATAEPNILRFPKRRDERRAQRIAADGGEVPRNIVALPQPQRELEEGQKQFNRQRRSSFKYPFTIQVAKKYVEKNANEEQ